jgi:hypothetical protein
LSLASGRPRPPRHGRHSHLASASCTGHSEVVDEEQGIYRGEVLEMMGALADISVGVQQILGHIEGDDDAEEEEDLPNA